MNRKSFMAYPYALWMFLFIIVPILLVLYYGFTIETSAGSGFSLQNFARFLEPVYLVVLLRSLALAALRTIICLLLGYPLAMILADKDFERRNIMLLLLMVPMWMNFLLRTYAWLTLLEKKGIINSILTSLNLPNINIIYTTKAVVLGMVYNFLPFMVLPIYTVLSKIDRSVIEAAEDLGADSITTFKKVIFPLSLPGVVSGITMVFMPAVTTFIISRLLGGGHYKLIGNLIEQQFLSVYDWNFGSAISIIMMIVILISMAILSKYEDMKEGGGLF